MAEKWQKTSSPDWRWMNPNPFAALNHFTVPCSLINLLTLCPKAICASRPPPGDESCRLDPAPLIDSKGSQERQTHGDCTAAGPGCYGRVLCGSTLISAESVP